MSKGLAYAYRVLGLAVEPEAPSVTDAQRACRKDTKRRFRELKHPEIPAEKLALGLLERRCAVCPHSCWGPGR